MVGAIHSLRALQAMAQRDAPLDTGVVAREFEALLIGEMLKSSAKPLFSNGMLSGGSAGQMYREQFMDAVAEATAARGGFGIGRAIERQLKSQSAAGTEVTQRPEVQK